MSNSTQGPAPSSHRDNVRDSRIRSRGRSPAPDRHFSYEEDEYDRHRRRRSSRSPRRRSRSRSNSRERRKKDHGRSSKLKSRSRSPRRRESSERGGDSERRKRRRSVSSSSDDSGHKRHKSKKHGSKHKRRSSRSRERKERKKEKKKKSSVTSQWGRHGIISETDLYKKEEEFRAWLVEECKINPETLSKVETKKRFQTFVEDYNTATLPHDKFYDMKRYEAHMSLLRNGELVPRGDEDTYDLNADMQAHASAHKRTAVEHDSYLSKEELKHLRRVQQERVEIAKRKQLGLEVTQSMGVRMDGSSFDD